MRLRSGQSIKSALDPVCTTEGSAAAKQRIDAACLSAGDTVGSRAQQCTFGAILADGGRAPLQGA